MYTKKAIVITHGDEILDVVPLHEVKRIRDMSAVKADPEEASSAADDEDEIDDADDYQAYSNKKRLNIVQIETIPDGYNSGRMYELQPKNGQEMRLIVADLSRLSAIAIENAEAKSRLKKIQSKIAKVIDSDWSQRILAAMIFAVNLIFIRIFILVFIGDFKRWVIRISSRM